MSDVSAASLRRRETNRRAPLRGGVRRRAVHGRGAFVDQHPTKGSPGLDPTVFGIVSRAGIPLTGSSPGLLPGPRPAGRRRQVRFVRRPVGPAAYAQVASASTCPRRTEPFCRCGLSGRSRCRALFRARPRGCLRSAGAGAAVSHGAPETASSWGEGQFQCHGEGKRVHHRVGDQLGDHREDVVDGVLRHMPLHQQRADASAGGGGAPVRRSPTIRAGRPRPPRRYEAFGVAGEFGRDGWPCGGHGCASGQGLGRGGVWLIGDVRAPQSSWIRLWGRGRFGCQPACPPVCTTSSWRWRMRQRPEARISTAVFRTVSGTSDRP